MGYSGSYPTYNPTYNYPWACRSAQSKCRRFSTSQLTLTGTGFDTSKSTIGEPMYSCAYIHLFSDLLQKDRQTDGRTDG